MLEAYYSLKCLLKQLAMSACRHTNSGSLLARYDFEIKQVLCKRNALFNNKKEP